MFKNNKPHDVTLCKPAIHLIYFTCEPFSQINSFRLESWREESVFHRKQFWMEVDVLNLGNIKINIYIIYYYYLLNINKGQ